MNTIFEWEKPLVELERRIDELQTFTEKEGIDLSEEIATLEQRAERLRLEIYESLTPWQRVMIARHKDRPTTLDYIGLIFDDFLEVHGDRTVREDAAMVGGIALLDGRPVTVIGPQKGRGVTKENIRRNFGLPHPEGYRKAMRLMHQAEKFGRPVVCLIDVVGAYPGIEAEERGQGVLIAESIRTMSQLKVPTICIITGEGGSGGALAIGVGDRMLMLENAWYSVISPEMCAQILWRDTSRASEAAALLKLTAHDVKQFGIVDEVLPEPLGGAHRDPDGVARVMKEALSKYLAQMDDIAPEDLVAQRHQRYRQIGAFAELTEAEVAALAGELYSDDEVVDDAAADGGAPEDDGEDQSKEGAARAGEAGGPKASAAATADDSADETAAEHEHDDHIDSRQEEVPANDKQ